MNFKHSKAEGILKKWLLVIVDMALFVFSNTAICFITNNGRGSQAPYNGALFNAYHLVLTSVLSAVINYLFRLYKSVWSFAGLKEIVNCAEASFCSAAMLFVVDKVLFRIILHYSILPVYAYVLNYIFLLCCTCAPRIGYRLMRSELKYQLLSSKSKDRHLKRVMIVGAGYMGNTIIEELRTNESNIYVPVVAVDDNPAKKGKGFSGVKSAGNIDEIP